MFEGYRLPEGEVGVWTLGYWWGMYLTRVSLLDIYPSYYGAFLCVCWSPDGKYILTGGQDDLVSIWSLNERQIVARCQGHHSWITAVAFDPWRCDERNYRFGSVGEDCKLLLWDFSVGMLHRPKATQIARQRGSISAPSISLQRHQTGSVATLPRLRSDSNRLCNGEAGRNEVFYHPVEPRARTAQLPPVMVGRASALPSEHALWYRPKRLTSIHFVGWDLRRIVLSHHVKRVIFAHGIGQEKGSMAVSSPF